jgi:hypothetical protein
MTNNAWNQQIYYYNSLSVQHLEEFSCLWHKNLQIQLCEGVYDAITWKLTTSGNYSASCAYKDHSAMLISTQMNSKICKMWAPSK